MIKIDVKLDDGVALPSKANDLDTGYDLVAKSHAIVGDKYGQIGGVEYWNSIDYIEYKTGLRIGDPRIEGLETETPIYTLLFPRSSISKYNLLLANSVGVVDNPYRGEIMLRFKYIFQPRDFIVHENKVCGRINIDKIYKVGDKVAQLVPMHLLPNIKFEIKDDLSKTSRGSGGFGSTGK